MGQTRRPPLKEEEFDQVIIMYVAKSNQLEQIPNMPIFQQPLLSLSLSFFLIRNEILLVTSCQRWRATGDTSFSSHLGHLHTAAAGGSLHDDAASGRPGCFGCRSGLRRELSLSRFRRMSLSRCSLPGCCFRTMMVSCSKLVLARRSVSLVRRSVSPARHRNRCRRSCSHGSHLLTCACVEPFRSSWRNAGAASLVLVHGERIPYSGTFLGRRRQLDAPRTSGMGRRRFGRPLAYVPGCCNRNRGMRRRRNERERCHHQSMSLRSRCFHNHCLRNLLHSDQLGLERVH